tara:strand:+ start:77 stop:478 length:402 start_codon:yes stop_codon:yes gene_type:complete
MLLIQEGFRLPEEYQQLGYSAAVSLSSSISGADHERICFHAELDHASDTGVTQGDNLAIYHGQLVIVKAYVADCINIDGTVAVMGSATQSSIALGTNGDFKHKQVILSICCWVSNCSVRSFLSLTMLSLCQNI